MRSPKTESVVAWLRLLTITASRIYRTMLLTMALIAVAPMLFGWGSYLIKSGSMEPSISTGDVVIAQPMTEKSKVNVGRVFVFQNPAKNEHQLLVHRIVERRDDGTYTSAGDANEITDATAVTNDDFVAQGVLLAPYIGLPITWAQAGEWVRLTLWLIITMGAFCAASRRMDGESPKRGINRFKRRPSDDETTDSNNGDHSTDEMIAPTSTSSVDHTDGTLMRQVADRFRRAAPAFIAMTLVAGGVTLSTANAGFTSRTVNGSSHWKAGAGLLPYTAAVLADKPFLYWTLDETSGNQGTDRSGNNRLALMTGVETGVPGAHPNNTGTAVRLSGTNDRITSGGNATAAPNSFTIEMWFRKQGGAGGKMIGFESTQSTTSSTYDRTVYMRNNGRIVYGAWSNWFPASIETPTGYADGNWHHLVVAVEGVSGRSSTARMYIDGNLIVSGATTVPDNYTGWWRVGSGSMPFGFNYPIGAWGGDVDSFAVYNTALPAGRITAHYNAR